jgi:hypothetical protein
MKTFKDYLTESKKTYGFKLKFAGDLPEGFEENLKTSLEKFSVVSLSKGKRTPIQDVPLDFPGCKNSHVTIYELQINYPTTSQVLTDYLSSSCSVDNNMIRVRSENEPTEEYQDSINSQNTQSGALLNTDYADQDKQSPADLMSLIKELENVKHQGEQYKGVNDQLLADKLHAEKEPELPTEDNKVSVVGSKSNKGN